MNKRTYYTKDKLLVMLRNNYSAGIKLTKISFCIREFQLGRCIEEALIRERTPLIEEEFIL